ncbi:MAG: transcription elongation factor GreA [Gammaproteobacteria bacterium]|nr:transcription elongation factor GreA [Gammaproteobacteria bacterium]MDD9806739.1 transcription elongation factor GreA [Gammaproteobacteria bacterium]MDD9868345.1 transcription elongation factor GreA [Gammaproteobacteria bacterium]MDD9886311.1 transcription elongation factor GreA [Gammaproteobacteria bacterium]
MERKKPITKQGAAQLREELQRLKNEERPKIKEALKTAREHGDLSENAEYKAARERQGFNEGRIKEIELCLSFCEVIDVATVQHNGRIVFGATVTLYDEAEDRRMTCQIVGEPEADMKANRVSITSPIARALIGKGEGDTAVVNAPGGDKTWAIEKISYGD